MCELLEGGATEVFFADSVGDASEGAVLSGETGEGEVIT